MTLSHGYKYRCKKCGFKGECNKNINELEIGKEHLDNSLSCCEKDKNNPQFFECSECQQEKKQEEIDEILKNGK